MKGELQMRFLEIADIEGGLGIFTIEEDCFKKKFASKNIFFSSSEWEKIRNQFKPEYFTSIYRQKPRFTRPSYDEVSMLLFKYL